MKNNYLNFFSNDFSSSVALGSNPKSMRDEIKSAD